MARTEDFDLGYTRRPRQRGKGIGWKTLIGASLFGAGASAAAMKAPEIMDLVRSNFGSERAVATPVGATAELPAEEVARRPRSRTEMSVAGADVRGNTVDTRTIVALGEMATGDGPLDRVICNYYFGTNAGYHDIGVLSGNDCITGEQADRLLEMGRESD